MILDDTDWATYFARARESLKEMIEDEANWALWTTSTKRYVLVTHLLIVENDVDGNLCGTVTGYLDTFVYSDKVEDLKRVWASQFISQRYSTTHQHFIADTQQRKVVELLSICA